MACGWLAAVVCSWMGSGFWLDSWVNGGWMVVVCGWIVG